MDVSIFISIFAFLCFSCADGFLTYNTESKIMEGKLNVHLVPHSHDDVGWLKTVDQYFVGSNKSIQGACVENTLDSVIMSLMRDPNRKFIFAEMAFFQRWWRIQNPTIQAQVRKLVEAGQLEFVNGGWCMHDEAATHYIDMIDQTTLGHLAIKSQFNKTPRAGWQIDPFGHSAVQAYLLGAEVGFDSVHFARVDYQDRAKRKGDKSLEVVWRGSKTFGSSSQIFANAFPAHYSPPNGFHFEVGDDSVPVQDDPLLFDYNVENRVNDFISAAITQANVTRTNHVMWTMGDDFQYQYAESWFKQMDKLIHYVNKDGRVNALYSTPSIYTDAKNAVNSSWPLKTDDYFPYADGANAYWTGFFTSRPGLKGYIRMLSGYYLVKDANCVVHDSMGNLVETQYVELDNVTKNLREFYTKAYIGRPPKENPKYWLNFQASVPPLGWNTYFISESTGKDTGARSGYVDVTDSTQSETVEIGNGNLKMLFSSQSGQLKRIVNTRTGVDVPMQQSYLWYGSSGGNLEDPQASGAYIFRPDGSPPRIVSRSVPLRVTRGPLVDEVYQQFNSWISQVIRVYKDKEHAEFEFTIGPIPTDDRLGKEVITKITANMDTDKVFYTDSNGRDFLKRVRDYRKDWPLSVTQPEAGNYYPLNIGIFTTDSKSELSVLVDRATGGASIEDGEIELMLHRRMISDDGRGVGEPLDETVCDNNTCEGLTIRGHYYLSVDQLGAGAQWRRTTGQEIYSPILLAFTHENAEDWKAVHLTKATVMDPNYSLPFNVALITLQELDDGNVLLRLAHLYEAGEDVKYSTIAKVELKNMFAKKTIKSVNEMSLSANQNKSDMKRMEWKVEGEKITEEANQPIKGAPVDSSTLIVELGPMEIRTFLLTIDDGLPACSQSVKSFIY